jgi:D-glycero-alpha-D-manno-heptose-7-phosphate kinase
MLIARAPLRLSLGGGATDLPSYYREHGGFLIAAAINKYVYVTVHDNFNPGYILKYSETERVERIADIKHPLFRESIKIVGGENWAPFEITSIADVPGGTGLGSSGTFTCAVLTALHAMRRQVVTQERIAQLACHIEIDLLNEPVGKQDQYIAAVGGLTSFHFHKNGDVIVKPVMCSQDTLDEMESNLLLFFTGYARSASKVLSDQDKKSKSGDNSMLENLHFTKDIGYKSFEAIEKGDLIEWARLTNVHWDRKRGRSTGMTNDHIDDWIQGGLTNGALGGKLVGAGGGGFLMFYAEDRTRLRTKMKEYGLRELKFRFDHRGAQVMDV